jgi:hypothetical protein
MNLMSEQEKTLLPRKGRRGPAPTGKGTQVVVRMQPNLLDRLDAYRQTLPDAPSRPEVIRSMVEAMLRIIEKDDPK